MKRKYRQLSRNTKERAEGKTGSGGTERNTVDMHNADDMHVKWKNKLTVTEQWNSQRAASLAWAMARALSVHLHGKKPFKVSSVRLELNMLGLTDITAQMWQKAGKWCEGRKGNSYTSTRTLFTIFFTAPGAYVDWHSRLHLYNHRQTCEIFADVITAM